MEYQSMQKIIDYLNTATGYTGEFKQKVLDLLPQLHYDYDFSTISSHFSILLAVDRVRWQFSHIPSVVCNWRDVGPVPFDSDFMAAYLSDYNDLFIVFRHPTDELQNIGVHAVKCKFHDDFGIGFELNTVSFNADNYISETEIIYTIDKTIKRWK